jgi:hypothetical protein
VRKESKRESANERAEARAKRTAEQQLKRLDDMFGSGQGAVRERARLQKEIEDRKAASKASSK